LRDEGILAPYLARLKEAMRVEAVVLFGSRVRGEEIPFSDLDLAVVSPDFAGVPRLRRIEQLLSLWNAIIPLEPLGFTPEELLALSSALLWEIVDEGKAIYDDGVFTEARRRLAELKEKGLVERVPDGWRG